MEEWNDSETVSRVCVCDCLSCVCTWRQVPGSKGAALDIGLRWQNKSATRLAEALWTSFALRVPATGAGAMGATEAAPKGATEGTPTEGTPTEPAAAPIGGGNSGEREYGWEMHVLHSWLSPYEFVVNGTRHLHAVQRGVRLVTRMEGRGGGGKEGAGRAAEKGGRVGSAQTTQLRIGQQEPGTQVQGLQRTQLTQLVEIESFDAPLVSFTDVDHLLRCGVRAIKEREAPGGAGHARERVERKEEQQQKKKEEREEKEEKEEEEEEEGMRNGRIDMEGLTQGFTCAGAHTRACPLILVHLSCGRVRACGCVGVRAGVREGMCVCVHVHVGGCVTRRRYDGETQPPRPLAGKSTAVHFNLYNNVWGTAVTHCPPSTPLSVNQLLNHKPLYLCVCGMWAWRVAGRQTGVWQAARVLLRVPLRVPLHLDALYPLGVLVFSSACRSFPLFVFLFRRPRSCRFDHDVCLHVF